MVFSMQPCRTPIVLTSLCFTIKELMLFNYLWNKIKITTSLSVCIYSVSILGIWPLTKWVYTQGRPMQQKEQEYNMNF
jgi:hypothetical protein